MYNCLNVVTFHYFWKMQSDVWGFVSIQKHISHYSQGDFSVNSITINGWLRNLLWSEASQVIQSYALSSICPYGFIFLIAHFIWAFIISRLLVLSWWTFKKWVPAGYPYARSALRPTKCGRNFGKMCKKGAGNFGLNCDYFGQNCDMCLAHTY